jgi:flagellin-like hook-associated protein FlgL
MTDLNNSLHGVFGVPDPDPRTSILGLVADMAAMKQYLQNSERRLDGIERAIANVQELMKAVIAVQSQAVSNTRRIDVLETRAESIDKNYDQLISHTLRIANLENVLITNGEYRIASLETSKTAVLGAVGAGSLAGLGWLFRDYLLPLLKG